MAYDCCCPDCLAKRRREQLRNDSAYQDRVRRVREDAAEGKLPPVVPEDYLVAAQAHLGRSTTSAQLSRMLFEARELISMWGDVVEARTGGRDNWSDRVIAEIDDYRARRGWSPHGFGGENDKHLAFRLEVGFWGEDTYNADLTRFSQAMDALEAQGVIKYQVQLGHCSPYPYEN